MSIFSSIGCRLGGGRSCRYDKGTKDSLGISSLVGDGEDLMLTGSRGVGGSDHCCRVIGSGTDCAGGDG